MILPLVFPGIAPMARMPLDQLFWARPGASQPYGPRHPGPAGPCDSGARGRTAAGHQYPCNPVGDFWAFAEADPGEHLSMEYMRPDLRKLAPQPDDALVKNRRRPILRMLEDGSPGVHDTLVASCDAHRYSQLGHQGYHDNCTDNLRMALSAIGISLPEIPCPLNLWMNTPPREHGVMVWLPPVSHPGDQVTFRAQMDLIAVLSACRMDLLPINGEDAVPHDLAVMILP